MLFIWRSYRRLLEVNKLYKKIFGIVSCILLLILLLPIGSSSGNNNVEIDIFSGTNHRNFGNGVGFQINNSGTEPATVTLSCSMDFFYKEPESFSFDVSVNPNDSLLGNFGLSNGIKRINVCAQLDDLVITRHGFSIFQFVIFLS